MVLIILGVLALAGLSTLAGLLIAAGIRKRRMARRASFPENTGENASVIYLPQDIEQEKKRRNII